MNTKNKIVVMTDHGLFLSNHTELRRRQLTYFTNWFCEVGTYNLSVTHTKKEKMSVCGNEGKTCLQKNCWCGIDVEIPKAKSLEEFKSFVQLVNNTNLEALTEYETGDIIALGDIKKLKENKITISWSPTKRCNYDCSYCTPDIHDNHSPFPDLEDMIQRATDIFNRYPDSAKFEINISGGEPTLWPDLLQWIKHIKSLKPMMRVRLLTNGTAPIEKLIDYHEHCFLIISLHHEYVTDKLLNKLEQFIKNTPHTNNVVLKSFQPHNYSDFTSKFSNIDWVKDSNKNPIVDKETNEWT